MSLFNMTESKGKMLGSLWEYKTWKLIYVTNIQRRSKRQS